MLIPARRVTSKRVVISVFMATALYACVANSESLAVIHNVQKVVGQTSDALFGRDGTSAIIHRSGSGATRPRLFTLDERLELSSNSALDQHASTLLSVDGVSALVSVQASATQVATASHQWTLAGGLEQLEPAGGAPAYVVARKYQRGGRRTVLGYPLAADSSTPEAKDLVDSRYTAKDLFASARATYLITQEGVSMLTWRGTMPETFTPVVRGAFYEAEAVSLRDFDVAVLIVQKPMMQTELEIRALPSGEKLDAASFPYSIVSLQMVADLHGHVLVVANSKQSVAQAEFLILNSQGRIAHRQSAPSRLKLIRSEQPVRLIGVTPTAIVEYEIAR
jgi:hypothetical protein